MKLRITIFGLAITSSWGNGHATTFRALCAALKQCGHHIDFFEKDVEWYASNRDLPEPPFLDLHLYTDWHEVLPRVRRVLADSDVALVGSYFPDAISALPEMPLYRPRRSTTSTRQ
jgi:spore maturation protein CgeB